MADYPFSRASKSSMPGLCPVSGLPITTRPEWTDLQLDEDFTASFGLIGDAILHVVPKGNPSSAGTKKLLEERAKILDSLDLAEKRYAEIRDYGMLTERPSKDARMAVAKFLIKETSAGHLKGFWVYNVPFYIRWMFRVGLTLHIPTVPVIVAKNYSEAVSGALAVLRDDDTEMPRGPHAEIESNGREANVDGLSASLDLEKDRQGTSRRGVSSADATVRCEIFTEDQVKTFGDELIRFIGSVNWDRVGLSLDGVREGHPLQAVFEALALIKLDLDDLLEKQEEARTSLRESEEKYRMILESIEDGYFEVDLRGNFTFFNTALCNLLGYPKDELSGKNNREYMDQQNARKVYEEFNNVYATGIPLKRIEYEIIRKDGDRRHHEVSVTLMRDTAGKPIGFRGIARDATERKAVELELSRYRESLEQMVAVRTNELARTKSFLESIFESSLEGIISTDTEGTILFASPRIKDILGHDHTELTGRNIGMLFEGGEEEVKSIVGKLMSSEVLRDHETRGVKRSGEVVDLSLSISLLRDAEGRVVGTTSICREVTENRRMAKALQQAKLKAEAASHAKSQFVANMSHEIRTPLNGIIGMTEMCLDTDLSAEQRRILNTIDREANSLLTIINTILDFSKIEAGKLQLEEIPFDLRNTLDDLLESFRYMAFQKGLKLTSSLSPDIATRVIGDPSRLRQVIRNLMGNAIKFTHQGEISLRCELEEDMKDRIKVRFLVKDTGIGIARDKQALIFDSFTQADDSVTRKYGGTGLGTTICKQLVELMGGEIGLESYQGKGTIFWFTALFTKQTKSKLPFYQQDFEIKGLKVLVVDNLQNQRSTLTEYLSSWGALPAEAQGGWEAIGILEVAADLDQPYQLVITDYNMLDTNGFELARSIKTNRALKTTRIILLTAMGQTGDGRQCKEIGIEGYLTKPFSEKELREVVELVMGLAPPEEGTSRSELITRHTIAEREQEKVFILLVEDYPTNQQVVLNHLKRYGCQVDLAEDGRKAVDAFTNKRYDLILMDIQMPVMDGHQATRAIRAIEDEREKRASHDQTEKIPRIPIIAMTAHAMNEVRGDCLEAGMDDYLSKPVRRKDLLAKIDKWLKSRARPAADAPWEQSVSSEPPLPDKQIHPGQSEPPMDLEQAVNEFEGDKELLGEVLKEFVDNVLRQIETIREALQRGDAEVVRREAHSIKGGASNLTARQLAETALELETLAKSGSIVEGRDNLDRLVDESDRLRRYSKEIFPDLDLP